MHLVLEALRRVQSLEGRSALGSALFVASVAGARADAIEVLQGAWVWESSDCTKVFEKIHGQIRFKDRNLCE